MRPHPYLPGLALLIALLLAFCNPDTASAQVTNQNDKTRMVVYIPLLSNFESVAPPTPENTRSSQLFGQLGRLEGAQGRQFDSYFLTVDGQVYGIVGADPDVEMSIMRARNSTPAVAVKVWGTLSQDADSGVDGLLVATGLLESGPVGFTTEPPPPVAIGKFSLVNLYDGPDRTNPRIGQIVQGQVCDLIGRTLDGNWWRLDCAGDVRGWIDARLVTVDGDIYSVRVMSAQSVQPTRTPAPPTATPTTQPSPEPTVTPGPSSAWRISYFNNAQLAGAPIWTTSVANLDLNWGVGSPISTVANDSFSARFERRLNFSPAGYYRFTVSADDGIRVWLDNELLIDEWHGSSNQSYIVGRTLAGLHDLRVEYFEASGLAYVRFNFEYVGLSPEWQADYFTGTELRGSPVLTQGEPTAILPLDYNWGYGGPATGSSVGTDYWSARWVGRFRFENGDYIFKAVVDDGMRLYLNDLLVLDNWRDGYKELNNRVVGIGAGVHTIRVEYYERTGLASFRLWWYRDATPQSVQ